MSDADRSVQESNKQRLREAIDTWNRGDWSAAQTFYAPDLIVHSPIDDQPLHGPDGFKRIFDILHSAFPDLHMRLEHMAADGDIVIGHWVITGTHTKPFVGFPASGRRVVFDDVNVIRMENGCAKEIWATPNLFGLMKQIGALPPGPPPKLMLLIMRLMKKLKRRKKT